MLRHLLLVHAGVTLAMVGVIWMVQLVHYPLFEAVSADSFTRYHHGHSHRISLLVIPLMLTEIGTGGLLWFMRPAHVSPTSLAVATGLLLIVWASTFFLQVPQHSALAQGFDDQVQRALVRGNWIRTFAWTARGLLVLSWLELKPM